MDAYHVANLVGVLEVLVVTCEIGVVDACEEVVRFIILVWSAGGEAASAQGKCLA